MIDPPPQAQIYRREREERRVKPRFSSALSSFSAVKREALALAGLVILLNLFRLDTYPRPGFDEGWFLQVPKNLVLYGRYATLSSEGFRPDDTVVSSAPTLYAPIALSFRLFGVGLIQARLVMLLYLAGLAVVFHLLARQLYGLPVALAADFLLFTRIDGDVFTSTLFLGRQALGEVPALFFFLLGALFWTADGGRRPAIRRLPSLTLSGLCFGLAMITKSQFALIVPAVLVVTGLITTVYYRQPLRLALAPLVVAIGVTAAWFGILRLILGGEEFARLLAAVNAAAGPQVRALAFAGLRRGLTFLAASSFAVLGLPALLYTLLGHLKREQAGAGQALLPVFIIVWLAWYLLASVGWTRYAYPALAVSFILVARLLYDLAGGFGLSSLRRAGATLILCSSLLTLGPVLKGVLWTQDTSAQQMAAYIDASVDAGEVIETWEWEVVFLARHPRFHLPPTEMVNGEIARVFLDAPPPSQPYDFAPYQPAYLLVGPFAKWTGPYNAFLAERGERIVSFGEYDLYDLSGG